MISDILSEALDDLEEYERRFPDFYGKDVSLNDQLQETKAAMRALLKLLDTPPDVNNDSSEIAA